MMESRERPTIMDGRVTTFAESFEEYDSAFGKSYPARGPYEVSASRNAVIVHRAEITSQADAEKFIEAFRAAVQEAAHLSRKDRGNFQ
jgi:hypothetical protein